MVNTVIPTGACDSSSHRQTVSYDNLIVLISFSPFLYVLQRSLNSTRFSGSPKLLQPEPTITCHAETGSASLLQTPEDTPTDPTTVIPTESCPERTHFPIVAPTSSSGNQLGDGYEARIKNDFEPELQPQIEGSDDGYMQRQRITDTPDISSVSDIVEIEIAPEDFASGYGPR